jgi:hypothetical protein
MVSLKCRLSFIHRKIPDTHFCRSQGHSTVKLWDNSLIMNWKAFECNNGLPSWHMPEGTEENCMKCQSRGSNVWADFLVS